MGSSTTFLTLCKVSFGDNVWPERVNDGGWFMNWADLHEYFAKLTLNALLYMLVHLDY